MSYREKIMSVPNDPGIYIFYDFDNRVLYLGRSGRLKDRLKEHFIRLNSSIVAEKNLDPREVAKIRYWIFNDNKQVQDLEKAFIAKYQPKLNLSDSDIEAKNQTFDIELPDESESIVIELDLPEFARDNPLTILKNKAHLIREMVLRFELAGVTPKGRRVLTEHCKDLLEIAQKI
ncbi:MAG: GIY-YIG nuclease family protein [Candidatus Hodarchaeota archaeon]